MGSNQLPLDNQPHRQLLARYCKHFTLSRAGDASQLPDLGTRLG